MNLLDYAFSVVPPSMSASLEVTAALRLAKEQLRKNPPMSVSVVSDGLAVRLRDGTVCDFGDDPVKPRTEMPAIAVTGAMASSSPGMAPSYTVPITGAVNAGR